MERSSKGLHPWLFRSIDLRYVNYRTFLFFGVDLANHVVSHVGCIGCALVVSHRAEHTASRHWIHPSLKEARKSSANCYFLSVSSFAFLSVSYLDDTVCVYQLGILKAGRLKNVTTEEPCGMVAGRAPSKLEVAVFGSFTEQ